MSQDRNDLEQQELAQKRTEVQTEASVVDDTDAASTDNLVQS